MGVGAWADRPTGRRGIRYPSPNHRARTRVGDILSLHSDDVDQVVFLPTLTTAPRRSSIHLRITFGSSNADDPWILSQGYIGRDHYLAGDEDPAAAIGRVQSGVETCGVLIHRRLQYN